jgi:hypothetical protein
MPQSSSRPSTGLFWCLTIALAAGCGARDTSENPAVVALRDSIATGEVPRFRIEAIRCSDQSNAAVSDLRRLLLEPAHLDAAARVIERLGADAAGTGPDLVRIAADTRLPEAHRLRALTALDAIGELRMPLRSEVMTIANNRAESSVMRAYATIALVQTGDDPELLARMMRGANDPIADFMLAYECYTQGPKAASTQDALVTLSDRYGSTTMEGRMARLARLRILRWQGELLEWAVHEVATNDGRIAAFLTNVDEPLPPDVLTALRSLLKGGDRLGAVDAAVVLIQQTTREDQTALRTIVSDLRPPDELHQLAVKLVELDVAVDVGQSGQLDDAIRQMLASDSVSARGNAISLLLKTELDEEWVLPELQRCETDRDASVQSLAKCALQTIAERR